MILSRRQFIAGLTAFSSSLVLPRIVAGADAGSGWSDFPASAKGERLIVGSDSDLNVHILSSKTLEHHGKVEVGFVPHSFLPHPKRPSEIWTIQRYTGRDKNNKQLTYGMPGYEKLTFRAVGIDLATGEITGSITADRGSEFRGHGYFLPDSDILFITRADMKNRTGHLTGYDVRTGKIVEDFKVSDMPIHEARLMQDGTVLMATAGLKKTGSETGQYGAEKPLFTRTGPDGVLRIRAKDAKQISFSPVESVDQALSHVDQLPDGRIIAVSKSRDMEDNHRQGRTGSVFIGKEGETLRDMNPQLKLGHTPMPSEMFSIAIDPKDNIVFVSDYVNAVAIRIDLASDSITSQWRKQVFGIVYNKNSEEFIAFGNGLWKLDGNFRETLQATDSALQNKPYSGSHGLLL